MNLIWFIDGESWLNVSNLNCEGYRVVQDGWGLLICHHRDHVSTNQLIIHLRLKNRGWIWYLWSLFTPQSLSHSLLNSNWREKLNEDKRVRKKEKYMYLLQSYLYARGVIRSITFWVVPINFLLNLCTINNKKYIKGTS